MSDPSRYWQFVRIDAAGGCRQRTIEDAKAFFQSQFQQQGGLLELSDTDIQHQLMTWRNSGNRQQSHLGDVCLRCFISGQIQEICIDLTIKFGKQANLTRDDFFSVILDDDLAIKNNSNKSNNSYQPLAIKILQGFDPSKGSLSIWTKQIVYHCQPLEDFLRENEIALKGGPLPKIEVSSLETDGGLEPMDMLISQVGSDRPSTDFLIAYGEEFRYCLERGIAGAIANRVNYLNQRKKLKSQDFLKALELFYRGTSMTEIAPLVGLKKQPEVSRKLLKLKEFRADVKRLMLLELKQRVNQLAQWFANDNSLESADREIDEALDLEVSPIFAEAQAESLGRTSLKNSQFARAIRQYFDTNRSQ